MLIAVLLANIVLMWFNRSNYAFEIGIVLL